MKRAPRSRQRHDLYAKYHDYDSEISDLLGECGLYMPPCALIRIYNRIRTYSYKIGPLVAGILFHESEIERIIIKNQPALRSSYFYF